MPAAASHAAEGPAPASPSAEQIEAAITRGAKAYRKGMPRKAVPAELTGTLRDAYLDGYDQAKRTDAEA